MKIRPAHPSQGEWVVINSADFDPVKMTPYTDDPAPPLRRAPGRPRKLIEDEHAHR